MFTKKTNMRVCRFCKAPNPERLTACYACGGSLTAIDPNLPKEGETTYPCLNCQGAIPFRAESCPHCGRGVTPAERSPQQRSRLVAAPEGWDSQLLPDGTAMIRRSGWNRWNTPYLNMMVLPLLLFMGLSFVGIGKTLSYRPGDGSDATSLAWYGVISISIVLFIGCLLIPLFLIDEIRAGRDFLEVRRELWFYRFHRRIERGYLRVQTELRTEHTNRGAHRQYWLRTLHAEGIGRPLVLQENIQNISWLTNPDSIASGFRFDKIAQLSVYLADVTGWKLFDDAAGRTGQLTP